MEFGYARVSINKQSLNLQLDALLKEGIDMKNIYTDKVSSTKQDREYLNKLLNYVRKGDTLVVWKLDRFARSLIHFTKFINELNEKEVRLRSIMEPFLDARDKSSHSQFIVSIFATLAQLERDIIIERTKAGLESARARGKFLGAPRGLSDKAKKTDMLAEYYLKEGKPTVPELL